MKGFRSIRWRLQLWHGLLLTLVLAGFVVMAWRLQRATQMQRVDQDLEERISVIAGRLPRAERASGRFPQGDRPPQARPGREDSPAEAPPRPQRDLRLSDRDSSLFDGRPGPPYYYLVWQREEALRSAAAPANVPYPESTDGQRGSRQRGTLRERFHFIPPDQCVLVGHDIGEELAGMRHFIWLLAAAGLVVLGLGWAGGWWISSRALRPIRDISRAAAGIAAGDLGRRIRTADTSSELGDLAGVLNDTFARLQAGFARQARFTADAAHELRTPVSVVLIQTQSALAHDRPAAEYRESLEACRRAAQRMRRLIGSLLTLARLDSGEAEPRDLCDMEAVALEAVELLRPFAREQGVDLAVETDAAPCRGHAEQLGQVVTNLVANAITYNRPGGRVLVGVTAKSGAAVLSVGDTGLGITPEDLPHIFERFYRADPSRSAAGGRTGLGLAITKAIVEAHGGTITVATEWGHGSTFIVRLPLSRA